MFAFSIGTAMLTAQGIPFRRPYNPGLDWPADADNDSEVATSLDSSLSDLRLTISNNSTDSMNPTTQPEDMIFDPETDTSSKGDQHGTLPSGGDQRTIEIAATATEAAMAAGPTEVTDSKKPANTGTDDDTANMAFRTIKQELPATARLTSGSVSNQPLQASGVGSTFSAETLPPQTPQSPPGGIKRSHSEEASEERSMLAAISSQPGLPKPPSALAKYRPTTIIPPFRGPAQRRISSTAPSNTRPPFSTLTQSLLPLSQWSRYNRYIHDRLLRNADFPPKEAPFHTQVQNYVQRWAVWIATIEDPARRKELANFVVEKMESVWHHGIDNGLYPRYPTEEQARAAGLEPETDIPGRPDGDKEGEAKTAARKKRKTEGENTWLFPDGLSLKPTRTKLRDKSTRVLAHEIQATGVQLDSISTRVDAGELDEAEELFNSTLENLGGDIQIEHWASKFPRAPGNPLGRDLLVYALHEAQAAKNDKIELSRLMRRFKKDAQRVNTMNRIDEVHVREQNFLALALELHIVRSKNVFSGPSRNTGHLGTAVDLDTHDKAGPIETESVPPFKPTRSQANVIWAARKVAVATDMHGMVSAFNSQGLATDESVAPPSPDDTPEHPSMAKMRYHLYAIYKRTDLWWGLRWSDTPNLDHKAQLKAFVEEVEKTAALIQTHLAPCVAELTTLLGPKYEFDPRKKWPFGDEDKQPASDYHAPATQDAGRGGPSMHESAGVYNNDMEMDDVSGSDGEGNRASTESEEDIPEASQSNAPLDEVYRRRRKSRHVVTETKATPAAQVDNDTDGNMTQNRAKATGAGKPTTTPSQPTTPAKAGASGNVPPSNTPNNLAPELAQKRHRYRQLVMIPKLNAIFRAAEIDEVNPEKFSWKGIEERLKDAAAASVSSSPAARPQPLSGDDHDNNNNNTATPVAAKTKIVVLRTHAGYDPTTPDAELDHTQLHHYKGFTWRFTPISTLSERRAIHDPLRTYIQELSAKTRGTGTGGSSSTHASSSSAAAVAGATSPSHKKVGTYEQFCLSSLPAADGVVAVAFGDGDARSKPIAHGYWDGATTGNKKGGQKQVAEETKWFYDGNYTFNDDAEVVKGDDGRVVGVVMQGDPAVLIESGGNGDGDTGTMGAAGMKSQVKRGGSVKARAGPKPSLRKRKRAVVVEDDDDDDDEDADYVDE